MKKLQTYCIRFFYMSADILSGYLAIFAACGIRSQKVPFDVSIHSIFFAVENPFRLIFALWLLIIIVLAHAHRLYHTDRQSSELVEIGKVVQSNIIAAVLMISLSYGLKVQGLPRTVVFISLGFK